MQSLEAKPVLLNVADLKLRVTSEEFERLCQLNRDLRLELTKDGELIVMAPTGGDTGERNSDLNGQLWFWNRQGLGRLFDSSTGYNFAA
uniref:Uma2 family endonuclease n=1 Tax=Chamaesiphon sp. TaxID=2814140 RepID=UPI0035943367